MPFPFSSSLSISKLKVENVGRVCIYQEVKLKHLNEVCFCLFVGYFCNISTGRKEIHIHV